MRRAIVILVVVFIMAVTAHAEQKNVKLLTGLTDREMQRTMNSMRAALGTHCDYCHVVVTAKDWDFASDQNPKKKRALKMIQMVMDINRNTFGGQPVVSCYTCHRGSIHPVKMV